MKNRDQEDDTPSKSSTTTTSTPKSKEEVTEKEMLSGHIPESFPSKSQEKSNPKRRIVRRKSTRGK